MVMALMEHTYAPGPSKETSVGSKGKAWKMDGKLRLEKAIRSTAANCIRNKSLTVDELDLYTYTDSESHRESNATALPFTGRKAGTRARLQMDSGDSIFFPCWDKSKPAILKLWELHQESKGGEMTAAMDEHITAG